MQITSFKFEHLFGNESPDYEYSSWCGYKFDDRRYWYAWRIVIPKAFLPALELYKVLLGDAWYDDTLWPIWLLEECRDSGMHLEEVNGMALESMLGPKHNPWYPLDYLQSMY